MLRINIIRYIVYWKTKPSDVVAGSGKIFERLFRQNYCQHETIDPLFIMRSPSNIIYQLSLERRWENLFEISLCYLKPIHQTHPYDKYECRNKLTIIFMAPFEARFRKYFSKTSTHIYYNKSIIPKMRGMTLVSSPHRTSGCASNMARIKVVPLRGTPPMNTRGICLSYG